MVCSNCGTLNAAGAKFCAECGTAISGGCANCGAALAPGAKFCSECGTPTGAPINTAAAAAGRTGRDAGNGTRTAPGPTTGPAPVAELRHVSIVFVDLVGFTTLSEGRDAEETRDLLSRYFELAREVIGRYGGTVEKFIGDAVMAVWGAPVAKEEDAERAVRAALDLVAAVPSLGSGLEARAGVLTGEAAVTLGATNQGMVAGDLVNTASRLQSVAPPGVVLVGESTERAASAAIAFEPMGEQQLKGKAAPVPAFRAVRVIAERGGRGRADGLEAPFVGRDDEFRLLKELVHATTRERRTRLVSITGQAGVGKSRMAWELSKYLDGVVDRVMWHVGRSPAYGEGIAFWALGEMVRGRAGLAETDDEATTRSKIAETVAQWVSDEEERRWIERSLLTLLGIEVAAQTRDELFSAWRTFFERIAESATAILVFEELHYADSGLLDFIDHLLDWSRGVPLAIITLARPDLLERRPTWGAGRRNFVNLDLPPLSEVAMRQLLAGLVPGLPDPVVRSIVARADGIPLYAVETVRMLVAEGKLTQADGAYHPSADLSEIAVPETLQALIAARLDALDGGDRSLMQDAAVLGQSFTTAGLAAVSGVDLATVEERLRALVRRELLTHQSDPRSPERGLYSFVQALIREVAYGTLAKRDRRSRHLAAARFFESLGEEELAGALASHYLAAYRTSAGDPEAAALAAQARIALKAAAARSASLGSNEQASSYLLEAIEVTDDPSEVADLLERAGVAAGQAGRSEAADTHLRDAIERRRELSDREGAARAIGLLGQVIVSRRAKIALELLEPAAVEFADLGDHAALAMIEHQLARARWFTDDQEGALEIADRALGRAERIDDVPLIADALITKGTIIAIAGRAHEGQAALRAGQALAEANGLTSISVRGLLNLGASTTAADPRESLEYARQAIALARRYGLRGTLATGTANALENAARTGDWDWAIGEGQRHIDDDLEAADRLSAFRGFEEVKAFRGEPIGDLLAAHAEIVVSGDSTAASNYHGALAALAFAEGRYADAIEGWERSADLNAINAPVDLPRAARAALWGGDLPAVARLFERFDALRAHGPGPTASLATIRAGMEAGIGHREEALALYAEAIRRWAESGVEFDLAVTPIDMLITLGPGDPAVDAAVAESRRILTTLRAKPFLDLIDRLTAPTPAASRETAVNSSTLEPEATRTADL
jgi:class 3 adenylate cyclase/tetratricopeptide (TPR) repeat protein